MLSNFTLLSEGKKKPRQGLWSWGRFPRQRLYSLIGPQSQAQNTNSLSLFSIARRCLRNKPALGSKVLIAMRRPRTLVKATNETPKAPGPKAQKYSDHPMPHIWPFYPPLPSRWQDHGGLRPYAGEKQRVGRHMCNPKPRVCLASTSWASFHQVSCHFQKMYREAQQ